VKAFEMADSKEQREMKQELLFNADGPALSILSATPSSVYDLMIGWNTACPEWDIRRVGGERSRTVNKPSFMNEVSAALQFPYYFGHNWSAFRECINDLSWLRGANFLIIFDSAQHLLSESDDDFQVLLRILADTHDEWRSITTDFGAQGRLPTAFRSVLACDPDAVDALTARISVSGATYVHL
jgi:hypothetical protein